MPSPSFLQLEFNTLQAGLITANANGTMTVRTAFPGPGASLVPGPETEVHLFRTGMAE